MKNLYSKVIVITGIYSLFISFTIAQNNSELIMSRIRAKLKPINIADAESVVNNNLSLMQADGSWEDINYQDKVFDDGWEPKKHNDRLLAFAQAYVLNSKYQGNSGLFSAIEKGLAYYYQVNPTSTHWWTSEIQAPQTILSTLIYLRAGDEEISRTLEVNIVNRFDALPEPTKHGIGANRSDVALWHLYQALLRDNASQLMYASDHLFNSFVTTTGNGIQHDYSYMDHGPQLYTYGYGVVLINNTNKAASYLVGTPYAMPAKYLEVYSNFLKSGYSTCLRGKYVSFSTLGRSISRANQVRKYAGAFNQAINIDPANTDFYQTIVDRSKGDVSVGFNVFPVNTHYYRSKFTTHNRKGYYFTVLTASDRTEKTETGNGENLKGLFLADGATNFLVNGDEYYNIFPVWDWTKIPGTTVPAYDNLKPTGTWGTLGTSNFTGGVSNGAYGAHVFAMNDYNTQVKKAWFCFDSEIVCLGAGLNSSAAEKINTTVNQCLLDGSVTISKGGIVSDMQANSEITSDNELEWVLHDNIGYFFPQGGQLKLSNQTQRGSWYAINNKQSGASVSSEVLKLWFDHGHQPKNASYAYVVSPGIRSVKDMRDYNCSNISILSNTGSVQAVKHEGLDMIQLVFYKASSLVVDGITIQADKSCAMVFSNVSTDLVGISIADPGENSPVINVYFESPRITGRRQLVCTMPQSIEEAGKSVNYLINEETPLVGNISYVTAIDDAFVRAGAYADVNYDGTYLDAKNAVDPDYTRNTFLKFDLGHLVQGNGKYVLRLSPTSEHTIACNFWTVDNDDWSEKSLTWRNSPLAAALIGESTSIDATAMEIDITKQVMDELAGDKVLTVKVWAKVQDGTNTIFHSKESSITAKHPVIKYETSASVIDKEKNHANCLYPNPAKDVFFVKNAKEHTLVSIYTLTGQVVKREIYNKAMNISELPEGVYMVVVDSDGYKLRKL